MINYIYLYQSYYFNISLAYLYDIDYPYDINCLYLIYKYFVNSKNRFQNLAIIYQFKKHEIKIHQII